MKLWLILQDSQSCEQHTRVRETGYRLNITSQSVVLGLKHGKTLYYRLPAPV
ncbi:hypothetical protein ACFSJQ_13725 [Vibrio olivae]